MLLTLFSYWFPTDFFSWFDLTWLLSSSHFICVTYATRPVISFSLQTLQLAMSMTSTLCRCQLRGNSGNLAKVWSYSDLLLQMWIPFNLVSSYLFTSIIWTSQYSNFPAKGPNDLVFWFHVKYHLDQSVLKFSCKRS